MFSRRSFSTVRPPQRKRSAQTALTACDMTVAHAAPRTPMPRTKIKMGSSTMFVTAPMTTVIMLIFEKPCAVMKTFMPSVSCTKIVPAA